MKIAILAPSSIPFEIGGAEKLWWGLQSFINAYTSHQCELFKIPTREHSFWDLLESYYEFYQKDVSSFDMVLTGKYPAWMVKHPNHHLYMVHCLRGLYDTYRLMNLPVRVTPNHSKINRLLKLIENNKICLHELFEFIFEMKNDREIPLNNFAFPGPLIRKVIHSLDKKAMGDIKTFSAISQTVAGRKEYYPEGTRAKVIYPPSNLKYFQTGSYDYFFTVSRLDKAKRVQMIIEAYLQTQTKMPLKIAGTGPLERELKDLTRNDPRVQFLGFLSDEELIYYYANAYAVLFLPYDEDYGLVTIEAMMSEKPVITFKDSGGATEFVENGKTGIICRPNVYELKTVIEEISGEPEKVMWMGKNAKKKIEHITWHYAVGELLNESFKLKPTQRKKSKLALVSTFPIYPPRGGGQNGIYYRYKELAKFLKVEIISLAGENDKCLDQEIASQLWEKRIPKSKSHAMKEWDIQKKVGIPVTDIAFLDLCEETVEFVEAVKQAIADADYVICAHPYAFPLVKRYAAGQKIVHESHNVEYLLKKQILPDNKHGKKLLGKVFEAEKQACNEAVLTTVVSPEDARCLVELYGLNPTKVLEVPSCVDLDSVSFTPPLRRMENKRSLGLENQYLVLFIGSWHQPNIEATERIFEVATVLPRVKFLIVGSVGLYFRQKENASIPPNVGFMGVVENEEKDFILGIVDLALNPMTSGSGINLKLLDYIAAGVPVISTPFGARGLNIGEELIDFCEIDNFAEMIDQHFERRINEERIQKARKFVEENYSWGEVVKKLKDYYLNQ